MRWQDKGPKAVNEVWKGSCLGSAVSHEVEHRKDESDCAKPAAAGVPDDLKVLASLVLGLAISGIPFSCPDLQADVLQY